MQYSPKLKIAAEEIKAILKKHDIAGVVVLHTPGFGEYILKIDPSYSAAKVEGDRVFIKGKKAHYKSVEERNEAITATCNMFNILFTITGQCAMMLSKVEKQATEAFNATYFDGGHTSNTEQNN